MHASPLPGVVFVDADDTLWENARFFEEAIDTFLVVAQSLGAPIERARAVLEECEDHNIPVTGYGAAPFVRSVEEAFRLLLPGLDGPHARRVSEFTDFAERHIREHSIDLLPGVRDGLVQLAAARPLAVLTKGQPGEQTAKVERSGLAGHFREVLVVREKTPRVYLEAAERMGASPTDCWMVGNSPRSDVNPARRAGFRTVLVAHDAPWHREAAALGEEGPETLVAATFADVPRLILG